jgi:hypothetical protein
VKLAPNLKRREDLVALRAFVANAPNGARLSWVEIETATSVVMRGQYGRNLFRSACHRERRRYLTIPGAGIELSSKDNALEIVERKNKKIVHAIKRSASENADVVTRHVDEMAPGDAQKLIRAASLSATLAMVRKSAEAPAAKRMNGAPPN